MAEAQLTIPQAFDLALQIHQAGRLPEAEQIYRQILAQQPQHADSMHYLGVIAYQTGLKDIAVNLIRQSIAINPNSPEAHSNLGLALAETGHLDEAITEYRQAIALRNNYAEAYNNLGNALKAKDQIDEAIAACRQAIALRPQYAEAHNNLANSLKDKGQLDEAIAAYRQAVACNPNIAEFNGNFARALVEKGQLSDAVAAYRRAIELKPDSPEWRFELAATTGDNSMPTAPSIYVRNLFDGYASKFDKHLVEMLDYRVPQQITEAVLAATTNRELDILDLGCGTGLCGQYLRPYAHRIVGVDISPAMIQSAAAREINGRKVYDELITADLLAAFAKQASYDLAVAADVLIYIGDVSILFLSVAKHLNPGGLFAFSIEHYESDGYFLHQDKRYAHSLAYIRAQATAAGLKEISAEQVPLRKQRETHVQGWIIVLSR